MTLEVVISESKGDYYMGGIRSIHVDGAGCSVVLGCYRVGHMCMGVNCSMKRKFSVTSTTSKLVERSLTTHPPIPGFEDQSYGFRLIKKQLRKVRHSELEISGDKGGFLSLIF